MTDMVQQPFRERERNAETEDSYVTTRILVTNLTVYPELFEALSSIEEDFFRTPITEEERKIAIHSCPETSSADSVIYGIQLSLAQATRPIDYCVHRRIQQAPRINTTLDIEDTFASTMRDLLADIAATVTQDRLENLHKGLDLPEKHTQLTESDTKPLMDQDALNVLISKKSVVKRQRVQSFCMRRLNTIPKDTNSSNTSTALSTNASITAEFNPSIRNAYRQSSLCGRGGRLAMFKSAWSRLTDSRWVRNIVERGFRIPFKNPHSPAPISKGALRAPFETGGTWRGAFGPTPSVSPSTSTADVPSASVQEKVMPRGQQSSDRRSRFITIKESYRRDLSEGSRLLQPAFYDPKEDWRPQTSIGPPQAQPARGGAKFQNGDTGVNLPHHSQKGLSHVLRSPRCVHAYTNIQELQEVSPLSLERLILPVPRPSIRAITEPVGIYQDSAPSSGMDQNERDARHSLPRRSSDNGGNEGRMCIDHMFDILQAPEAWVQGQRREIGYLPIPVCQTPGNGHQYKENDPQGSIKQDQRSSTRGKQATERREDDIEMSNELYWESTINVDCSASGSPYALPTSRTKESIAVDSEIMDIDSHTDETCHSEHFFLEGQTDVMERALILARDARIENIHGFQRHSLGNSGGIPNVLRIMESKRGKNAHKRQGITHSTVRPQTQEKFGATTSPKLLRIAEQTWNHCLESNTRPQVTYVPSVLNSSDALSRLTAQTEWSLTHEAFKTLNSVYVQHDIDLFASRINKKVKSYFIRSPDTNLKSVSGPIDPVNLAAGPSASNHNHTGSKKRKVAAHGKKALALDDLED
ncbi:hypothetical protein AYI70_g8196 [Smittium culicis]|uniref:Uncharacterized protein n=1 Tax=Smittium culicis TaxID=133412 RepID=A0A1R1XH67_9FUNG|nr:hypothetical protein AYI70_g8196 [Smittium culicis]